MNKKQLAVIGGICTIVGAATAASQKKKWEEAHQLAALIGAIVTIAGLFG